MVAFTHWRGYDLSVRIEKIRRAFLHAPVTCAEDVPILINTPTYFSFGSQDKPPDYYTNPASMLRYQEDGYEQHLKLVQDDYVPYFMPWFGTGVLASAFGADIRIPDDRSDDPAVSGPVICSIQDAARLRLPDPYRDGWMPKVLNAIDYALEHSQLPVGLTDLQGPLDTLGQLCGQAQLYEWMYSEPQIVHDLMALVTEAFIAWVKVQKAYSGEGLDWSYGLQGAFSPGCGVWESDDDLVLINPELYQEFVVPYVSQIFDTFGNGSVHFCGDGSHQVAQLNSIPAIAVVNNSPLGKFQAFHKLYRELREDITIQIQDASPARPESYYPALFSELDDFRGLMLVTFVMDGVAMDRSGGYTLVNWNPFDAANRIVTSVRQSLTRRLAGEDTSQLDGKTSPAVSVVKPVIPTEARDARFNIAQKHALAGVRQTLLDLKGEEILAQVSLALAAGVPPFDIVLYGLSEGMTAVGDKYQDGEYFLPELMMAGKIMQKAMTVLRPYLVNTADGPSLSKAKVVLGTVKGDLHDIGKHLVQMMLESAQFEVIDIGVDVSPDSFVEAVRLHQPAIVGLSALLTTTLKGMAATVQALEQAGLREGVKVMVGGAPISREFADSIGAEGYAATAVEAVYEAQRLLVA